MKAISSMHRLVFLFCLCWFLFSSGCAGLHENQSNPKFNQRLVGDFSLRDLKGKNVRLKDFHGKVVLLAFWATWCEPCRTELSQLQTIWDRFRDQGMELIAVNVDPADTESSVRQYVRQQRFRFKVLLDQETEVANRFNPTMDLPYSVMIDRTGRIAHVHQGYRIGDENSISLEIEKLVSADD
jgi:peroxiredoxin